MTKPPDAVDPPTSMSAVAGPEVVAAHAPAQADAQFADALWPGDTDTLPTEVRAVLVRLVQGPYVSQTTAPNLWARLVAREQVIRSRAAVKRMVDYKTLAPLDADDRYEIMPILVLIVTPKSSPDLRPSTGRPAASRQMMVKTSRVSAIRRALRTPMASATAPQTRIPTWSCPMPDLFNALETADLAAPAAADPAPGQFRLVEMQLINWGTFADYHVITVPRHSLLLAGESGSGKFSILDAMTAIMVPPGEARFNAAASGTTAGDRERGLMSYVRGADRKQSDDATQEIRTAHLRAGPTCSGISMTWADGAPGGGDTAADGGSGAPLGERRAVDYDVPSQRAI